MRWASEMGTDSLGSPVQSSQVSTLPMSAAQATNLRSGYPVVAG